MIEPLRDGLARRRASPWVRALGSIWLCGSAVLGPGAGCVREPEACLLELEEGDVVITEIRGPQDELDQRGEWIELYNATDRSLDLRGLRGTIERLRGSDIDGEAELAFLVRESLLVEPGGYVVLGTLPLSAIVGDHVDYSINDDLRVEPGFVEETGSVLFVPEDENADPRALLGSARLSLFACERQIDSFAYSGLPGVGTLSHDGSITPDADANDDQCGRWCFDQQPPGPGDTEPGVPGTPGAPNLPCEPDPACPS